MNRPDILTTELLVIGGGAAGMAAAASAASCGVRTLLCDERDMPGGILHQCIHSGFGTGRYGKDMTGPEYSEAEQRKFFDSGAAYLPRTRVLSLSEDRTAAVTGPEGLRLIGFRECVIAAGCMERPIGALNVAGTRPRGVYTAGEAQELINIDHRDIGSRIFILGSGDIGMIMARRFSLLGKEVVRMAEIRGVLGGMARNRRECVEAFGIPVSLNSTVTEIHGWPDITGVTLRHLDDGTEELVGCDALITSIGLIPDRSLADPLLTDDGYPVWLHFCGNADEVHEIADSVSSEGDRLGAEIAERLNPAKQN